MPLTPDEMTLAKSADRKEQPMEAFALELMTKAQDAVSKRAVIEDRWLLDMRQYHGRYDPTTEQKLRENTNRSQVFVNRTRPKCNSLKARLIDMLFPTDEKNWGIRPTPVPQLAERLKDEETVIGQTEQGNPVTAADGARGLGEVLKTRAEAMEKEIDDQLTESDYVAKCRDAIHEACVLGTGVLKGPIVQNRSKKRWIIDPQNPTGQDYVLARVEQMTAGVEWVSAWDYYPDPTALRKEDVQYEFELHHYTRADLMRLRRLPNINSDVIDEMLQQSATQWRATSQRLSELREITGQVQTYDDGRYEVWEYTGPATADDLMACGCDLDEQEQGRDDLFAIVLFWGPYVLRASLYPMEWAESPYDLFVVEKDETSPFGLGVPFVIRNSQKVANAAWRTLLENAALSSGPQIVIDEKLVEPVDGVWGLSARKLWRKKSDAKPGDRPFETFDIPAHLNELMAIFERANELCDEESNLPMIAQGEQGSAPNTFGATSILMNASNVVLRGIIKGFDDDVTTRLIARFYDWNMEHNPKPEIKGDFLIEARGSSVLMVKELQSQTLIALLDRALSSPDLMRMTDLERLYRKTVETMHITAEDIVLQPEEIERSKDTVIQKLQQQLAQMQEQGSDRAQVEQIRANAALQGKKMEMENHERERKFRMLLSMSEAQRSWMEFSANRDIDLKKVGADLMKFREKLRQEQQQFVDEANLKLAAKDMTANYGLEGSAP